MKFIKQIILSLTLLFTAVSVNAYSLEDFLNSLSEQDIITQWIHNNSVKTVSLDKAKEITRVVFNESLNQDISQSLIIAIIRTESNFNERVVSKEGARGLLQVIPRWHKDKLKGRNPSNIFVSIEVGTKIIKDCMDKHNKNIAKSLNCYSGGGGNNYKKIVMSHQNNLNKYIQSYRVKA